MITIQKLKLQNWFLTPPYDALLEKGEKCSR